MNLLNFILNTAINSVLEEGFIYGFSLLILSAFKAVEINANTTKRLIIPIIFSAVMSNVLRLIIPDINITLALLVFSVIAIICVTYKISFKRFHLIFIAVFASILLFQVIELYIPVYLKSTGHTLEELKKSAVFSFYVAIPERLVEYLILFAVYLKRMDYISVEFSKLQKRISVSLLTTDFIYYCYIGQYLYKKSINNSFMALLAIALPIAVLWVSYSLMYISNRQNIKNSIKHHVNTDFQAWKKTLK